jgi:hypothetical protein
MATTAALDNFTVDAGKWTQEEQDQLKQAVEKISAQPGKSIGCDGFWSEVSEAMEGKHSRKRCYKKWSVA